MDKTLAVQMQIRQNAEEISSALKEIKGWEKVARDKDKSILRKAGTSKAKDHVRTAVGTVPIRASTSVVPESPSSSDPTFLTPASIVNATVSPLEISVSVPAALGSYQQRDMEEVERERGNAEFKAGNFSMAVKCYTKCLGLKAKNYIAFSNRAMAYLKLKEYARAVADCNCALSIEPSHVKSLLRRATAFSALGKLRAAVRDLLLALELEPTNKQARVDIAQVREQLRNAVARAPMVAISNLQSFRRAEQTPQAVEMDDREESAALQGPDPIPLVTSSSSPASQNPEAIEEIEIPIISSATETPIINQATVDGPADYVRIAIATSDDEQEDGAEEPPQRLEVDGIADISPTKRSTSASARLKKIPSKKSSSSRKAKISGAYELEKELLRLQHDVLGQWEVLKMVSGTLGKVLRDAVEPEALRLLLQAVLRVHKEHPIYLPTTQVLDWFDSVRKVPNFKLLFTLLPKKDASVLMDGLREVLAAMEGQIPAGLAADYML